VDAVRRVVDETIAPAAFSSDEDAVPRSHLDALAATGLLGAAVDPGVPAAQMREAQEVLAAGCLATWFVQAQHHSPVRLVTTGPEPIRQRLLPLLTSGTSLAGIAFSHLRRYPDRPVEVRRTPGGWVFRGTAPWYTGWGINDVAVIAGVSDRGEVVFALMPAEATPHLRPGEPSATLTIGGARTVPLHLDDVQVGDDGVLAVEPVEQWRRHDEAKAANVSPAVLGVTHAALRLLSTGRDDRAWRAADRLRPRADAVREEAYALLDADASLDVARRLELRAEAIRLGLHATQLAVIAGGGRSMLRTDRAQLYARWALFLSVQAQTAPLRAALLG
jgi:alkylation response protein AidB-like acyl-CoA dehydrogenase